MSLSTPRAQQAPSAEVDILSAGERLSASEIPISLICDLCGASWADERAFRGHMAAKHNVLYELTPQSAEVAERIALMTPAAELTKLKPYMALAIARHEVYGESWEAVSETIGKSPGHLSECARSPAGREFTAHLTDMMGDAKSVVKMLMESATLQMYMDWFAALEWAKTARDHKAVHTMLKDVGLQPVLKELERDVAPQTLTINITSADAGAEARSLINSRAGARAYEEGEYILED